MKKCPKCSVSVVGERELCPLCQGGLKGEKTEEVFPLIQTVYRDFHFLFRLVIFISISLVVAALAVNFIWKESGWWSVFWIAGTACLWIILWLAVRKRKNIPRWILYQVVVVSLICSVWDFAMGWRGWSVDYAIPILCLVGLISLGILSIVLKWKVEYFMVSFGITALFGIVPVIFYATGLLSVLYPTVVCVAGSVISLAALCVFKGESMLEELKRRLAP